MRAGRSDAILSQRGGRVFLVHGSEGGKFSLEALSGPSGAGEVLAIVYLVGKGEGGGESGAKHGPGSRSPK